MCAKVSGLGFRCLGIWVVWVIRFYDLGFRDAGLGKKLTARRKASCRTVGCWILWYCGHLLSIRLFGDRP